MSNTAVTTLAPTTSAPIESALSGADNTVGSAATHMLMTNQKILVRGDATAGGRREGPVHAAMLHSDAELQPNDWYQPDRGDDDAEDEARTHPKSCTDTASTPPEGCISASPLQDSRCAAASDAEMHPSRREGAGHDTGGEEPRSRDALTARVRGVSSHDKEASQGCITAPQVQAMRCSDASDARPPPSRRDGGGDEEEERRPHTTQPTLPAGQRASDEDTRQGCSSASGCSSAPPEQQCHTATAEAHAPPERRDEDDYHTGSAACQSRPTAPTPQRRKRKRDTDEGEGCSSAPCGTPGD